MKIAIASAVYFPMTNGVAVFTHNLAQGLAEKGHEVIVLCPSFTGKHHVAKEGKVKNVCLKSIRMPIYPDQIHAVPEKKKMFGKEMPRLFYKNGFWVCPTPGKEVKKALDKFKPDVIHCQIADPIGLAVTRYARKNHVALVSTEHNYPDVITEQIKALKPIKKPADAALTSFLVNHHSHSDYVTMPTQMAIDDIILSRKKEFTAPVRAISNGVDLSAFKPGRPSATLYKKHNLPNDQPIVLHVGRVDPEKNIGIVVSAFKAVLEKVPEALLVIVGDGTDRINLELQAKELGISDSVRFLGRLLPPELYEAYRFGDVFATGSDIETQGIVLIEAAASGLPLVAVDAGAVKEICHTNKNGFLCKPNDVKAIARGLIKILSDEEMQKEFSKNSLAFAKEHDLDKTVDKFVEVYQEAIKARANKK